MLTGPYTVKNVLKPKTKGKFDLNLIEKAAGAVAGVQSLHTVAKKHRLLSN